jgi:hypothetical protein
LGESRSQRRSTSVQLAALNGDRDNSQVSGLGIRRPLAMIASVVGNQQLTIREVTQMRNRSFLKIPLSVLLLVASAAAQVATASIEGDVLDPSGAAISGGKVTLASTETGGTRSTTCDANGHYSFKQLPVGQYDLQVEAPGFGTLIRKGVVLVVGQAAVVNLSLRLGGTTEKVEVTDAAPLLEVTKATLGGVVDEGEVKELPLNTRSFTSLATQEPGVTVYAFPRPTSSWTQAIGHEGSMIVVNGLMGSIQYLMDGTSIAASSGRGSPGTVAGDLLGVEAIREFNILTLNYDAQYGNSAGAVINYVTKEGTNSLHGSAYEYLRNSALDTRNFFDPVSGVPPFKRNQFGVSLGGPIKKNKSFFFGNYEGYRQRLQTTSVALVPDENARKGILPDETVTVSPAVVPFLSWWPLPNGPNLGGGVAESFFANNQPVNQDYFSGRFDQDFTVHDHLMVRYTFARADTSAAYAVPSFSSQNTSRNQYVTINETHLFSSNTVNSASFGFNRTHPVFNYSTTQPRDPSLYFIPQRGEFGSITFGTLISQFAGGTTGTISSIGTDGTGLIIAASNTFQLEDTVTRTAGSHTLTFGGQLRRYQNNKKFVLDGTGNYTFGTLKDFLIGNPANLVTCPGYCYPFHDYRTTWFAWYVNDNWRVNNKLTLTLGFRHEFNTIPTEATGHYANLDPLNDTSWRVGTFEGAVDNYFPYRKASLYRTNPTLRQFEPRVGFAYRLDDKMVLRAGAGIFHNFASLTDLQNQIPNEGPYGGLNVYVGSPLAFPQIPQDAVPVARIPGGYVGDQGTLTTYQWNLTLERELTPNTKVDASYIGSRGNHLGRWSVWNTAVPTIVDGKEYFPPGAPSRMPGWPFPDQVTGSVPDANAWYHAVEFGLHRQFSRGFQLETNYLFSKGTADSEDFFLVNWAANVPPGSQDPYCPKCDWGRNAFNPAQRLTFRYTWQLPFGAGRMIGGSATGVLDKVISGWSLSGLNAIQSGLPLTPYDGFNRSNNGNSAGPGDRPDLVPGCSNNPVTGSPSEWFNVNCFALQPAGFYGNLGRNTVNGPGIVSMDIALLKSMPIKERSRLEFRAEFFNFPNHTNFGVPNITLFAADGTRNPSAGRIFTTTTTSRQVQLALKFIF